MDNEPTRTVSLAEAFPLEQQRIREMIEIYGECGPGGRRMQIVLNDILSRSMQAAANQDVVAMLKSYYEMKEEQL
jgi:hypothetical protein